MPGPVRQRISAELDDWRGTGASVMEVSHRSPEFTALAEAATGKLRRLLAVPDHYEILFLQGGASTQFALVPLNLRGEEPAIYAVDGHWGRKAWREGCRVTRCLRAARSALPGGERCSYLHLTSNETVDGRQWRDVPAVEGPIVCDMSSDILSRPVPVRDFGLIYAGAQKNLGIAGLTVLIMARDLLTRSPEDLPTMLNYAALAAGGSMANTPPTFAWYVADCVLDWIDGLGGLETMARRNAAKARALYQAIDDSGFYVNEVPAEQRSLMNVVFRTPEDATDAAFLEQAEAAGLRGLRGHRAVGGLRASIYNAIEPEEVDRLLQFMAAFRRRS